MSTLSWNQIEITEAISCAFPYIPTPSNKEDEDDAWLWSKTSMQQFRSRVDAQVYLDGLFNDIDFQNPKQRTHSPAKEFRRSINHGESHTGSGRDTHGITQSYVTILDDYETHSPAASRLRQSTQNLRCWAPAYNGLKEESSKRRELVREVAASVRDLLSENDELSQKVAMLRRGANKFFGRSIWPVTLRATMAMRIMEANFGQPTRVNDHTFPFPKTEELKPIPITALDVTLSPDQVNQLGHLLPSGVAYSDFYYGLCIHTCTKCCKSRFRLLRANCTPLFRNLSEYPKSGDALSFMDICSPCCLETLLRAIWRDWWHNLGNVGWLRLDWDQTCCTSWISDEETLVGILESLGCRDVNDVDDYVKKFKKALKYRLALHRLAPRPGPLELAAAADLHMHLIKRGCMRNFFGASIELQRGQYIPKFDPGPITVGCLSLGDDNLKVPIFVDLFRRQRTPKECIICAEEKYEVDYGTTDKWIEDCGKHTGPWMWSILEYPTKAIQSCDHDLNVCRSCTEQHISVSLESGDIDRIACPECDRILLYEEIANLGKAETFERYDRILLRRALSREPNFRWCLSQTCENGQVYDDVDISQPAVRCDECGFRMCFRHQQPWHRGMTCAEFDSSRTYGDPKYVKTQEYIMANTKVCPNCGVGIEKNGGCFHMTCRPCKHEFCWECLADWESVRNNRQAHNTGCFFRENAIRPTEIAGVNLQEALHHEFGD